MATTGTVKLADEVDANSCIFDRVFEQATIQGPAVVAFAGNVSFDNETTWHGEPDSMLIEVPKIPATPVQGVILLRNVSFRSCRFVNVAIIGPPELIAKLRDEIKPNAVVIDGSDLSGNFAYGIYAPNGGRAIMRGGKIGGGIAAIKAGGDAHFELRGTKVERPQQPDED